MPAVDPDAPILDVAHDDAALSHMIRNSLQNLVENTDDERVHELVGKVLEGHYSLRDVFGDPAFNRALARGVRDNLEQWGQASEQERQEMVELGRARYEAVREELEKARRERGE